MKTKFDKIRGCLRESDDNSDQITELQESLSAVAFTGDYNDLLNKPDNATVPVTYAALRALRDGGNLMPGQDYRITDYQCTTALSGTASAGHVFDIIVTAIDASHLGEDAKAAHHEGDTYFASQNLDAWRLKYCLDNDTARFEWADAANGKGVVYSMVDDRNNEAPYDFKNILYNSKYTFNNNFLSMQDGDASLDAATYGNVVKPWIVDNVQKLNNIIFTGSSGTGYSNFDFNRNVFGANCRNITINGQCSLNVFGVGCQSITLGSKQEGNIFGNFCSSIVLKTRIHTVFSMRTYYPSSHNVFGEGCSSIESANEACYNVFEPFCHHIKITQGCDHNHFGQNASYVIFGTGTYASYTGKSYVRNVDVKSGAAYISLTTTATTSSSLYLQNIVVDASCSGSSSAYAALSVDTAGQDYETHFKKKPDVIIYTDTNP